MNDTPQPKLQDKDIQWTIEDMLETVHHEWPDNLTRNVPKELNTHYAVLTQMLGQAANRLKEYQEIKKGEKHA